MESDSESDLSGSESDTNLSDSDVDLSKVPTSYVLSFPVSEPLRRIFTLVLIVGNFLSLNCGVVFLLLSWFVRNSLQKQIAFLQEFYQPRAVPVVLVAAGLLVMAASLLGLRAAIGGDVLEGEEEAKSAAFHFFLYWVSAAVASVVILVAAITCFAEVQSLSSALGRGLKAGMAKYGRGGTVKSEIDLLQLEYRCCGADGYEDWYEVAWIDVKFLDLKSDPKISKKLKGGKYFGQDVPFSCCRRDVVRPCVDARIEDSKYHSQYSYPTDLTLHVRGCREAVTNFLGRSVFRGVGAFVLVCLFISIAMTVIGRYLHTSMTQMSVGQPPVGWLIPFGMPKKSSASSDSISMKDLEDGESGSDASLDFEN